MTKRLPPFDSIRASVTSSSTRSHLKMRILNKQKTNKQTSGQKRRRSRLVTHGGAWTHCRVTALPAAAYLRSSRAPAREKHEARGKDGISGGAFQTKRPYMSESYSMSVKITLLILEALLILKRR